jgi:NAD+-dependent protein deacetylase sirtuin 4
MVRPSPSSDSADWSAGLEALAGLVRGHRVVVLSGAGCSTESGIPDYRGPDGRNRSRRPMLYQEFVSRPEARARYWSRSAAGWARFRQAAPNEAHRALAHLEDLGRVSGVITQNVDGLHDAAGSRRVLELHGSLARVGCLECGLTTSRDRIQEEIGDLNPGFAPDPLRVIADGDAELEEGAEEGFVVPACRNCGGVLKPDVVFFGENVPKERVRRAWSMYEAADFLLVVGSSLTVFSGRRFVLRAEREGRPVGIVNLGPTRCDALALIKVEGRVGRVLPRLVEAVAPPESP